MAQYTQDFEGTVGATLTTANLAGAGQTAPNTVIIDAGSGLVFDNTHVESGSTAAKATPASGQHTAVAFTGLNSSALAVWGYLWLDTAATQDVFFVRYTVAGNPVAQWRLQGTNKVRVSDNTSGISPGLWTAAAAHPLGQWVRWETYATVGAGTATVKFAYYLGDSTTPIETFTTAVANTGSAPFDAFTFGKYDTGTYTAPHWYDRMGFDDAATGLVSPPAKTAPATVLHGDGNGGWI